MKKKDIELIFKGADEQSWKELLDDLRPKGIWKVNKFGEHICPICGHYALYEEEQDNNYYEVPSNFCPECGADLREE